ncbi:hypothetical protein Pla163_23560 [Planctomycetes bacterium Pla163]|uniref:Spore protein YkvP/CgeB glycosyl transferase-like domain-containing protein n=1 Tax=Rohdeia mirabilis TaxID=2528008 RepID=A0A518D162_9BACT|nr:hypothetical protein Pla163_23560 [Planctomycetes bacterium Pla163]
MDILYVGELTPNTRCEQRLRVFRDLGHDVTALPFRSILDGPHQERRLPPVPRVMNKLGFPLDSENVNTALVNMATRSRFDLLWVEKAPVLRAHAIESFARLQPQARLVYFSEDDMALRHNGSFWFRGALPLYDVVVTTKLRNLVDGELEALGAQRVVYEPKTFDPKLHRPIDVDANTTEKFGADVLFVGTYERERAASCLNLARAGISVRVFGMGWQRFGESHPNLRVEGRAIGGDDYVAALCSSKIALGFLRRASRDEHTDRSVEIPACGGFMLAERSSEHLELFRDHREAVFFDGDDELIGHVERYLGDDEARRSIAAAGRRRCLDSGYDHASACRRMLAAASGAPHRSERDARPVAGERHSTTSREVA